MSRNALICSNRVRSIVIGARIAIDFYASRLRIYINAYGTFYRSNQRVKKKLLLEPMQQDRVSYYAIIIVFGW
jgi:hypothetical protein